MGLRIRAEGGRHIPIVTCDSCGTVIDNADMGGVVFPWPKDGETVPIRVLCKVNHCLAGDRTEAWLEMGHWLIYMLHNTGIRTARDFKREQELADLLSTF